MSDLVRQAGVSDAVARVLAARGVLADRCADFLRPTLKALMPDPSLFVDMDGAAARIVRAVENGERIAVFGDYDVDGATSSALLMRFFRAIGVAITVYIPDRAVEGYGPNTPALLKLRSEGIDLVITVDCGIVAYEPLAAAKDAGLDIIVVDHHKAEPALPIASAVVNPNRLDCASRQGHLAAVGVAFLLVVAVNRALRNAGWYAARGKSEADLKQWLDLVALGTVCDVVPLTGLNRAFVTQGLNILAKGGNVGLVALARVARIDTAPTAFHLGYLLGPRVNAGGRVGQADLGTRLLSTEDAEEAAALALRLDEYNASRKEIEAAVLREAIEQVESRADNAPLIFAAGEKWHPGVIGIVAGRLKERYDRPTCVVAVDGGLAKGSGRSIPGVDLGRAVLAAREAGYLMNGGGHAMAAGFTLLAEKLDGFAAFMQEQVSAQLKGEPMVPTLSLDGALSVSAVTPRFIEELSCVGPFGAGNDEPRFAVVDARVVKADIVGQGHVRCILTSAGGGRLKAIAFNCVDDDLGHGLLTAGGGRLHLAGTIRADTWQGRTEAQLVIDDAARCD
ncbi:MAG: single-stranded-DNA-specific exonuclease RecJ [Rhodospirillaceae bacterium]